MCVRLAATAGFSDAPEAPEGDRLRHCVKIDVE